MIIIANEIVESNAVDAIKRRIRKEPSLRADIKEGDTYPSWDGDIFVYPKVKKHENFSKDKMLGRIPVQVKGIVVKEFSDEECKFDIEVADLNNYLNDGGAIFFVVEMTDMSDSDATEIFYTDLLPVDIRLILKEKEKQKTIRHTLKKLPENRLYTICNHFIIHRKKQPVHFIKSDGQQFNRFSISTSGTTQSDLDFHLFDFGTYIYGIDEKNNIEIPLHRFIADTKIEQDVFDIGIEGEIYYSEILREITRSGRKTMFGKSFSMEIRGNDILDINFKESGNLKDRIKDCTFFLKVVKNSSITLNQTTIPIQLNENKRKNILEELPQHIGELKDFSKTFYKLGIDPKEDFDKLKKDIRQLKILKDVILNKNNIKIKETGGQFQELQIGNYKILLSRGSDKYNNQLFNFFNYDELKKKLQISIVPDQDFEKAEAHSPYITLNPKQIFEYSNLNINSIEQSLENVDYSRELSSIKTNQFLLDSLLYCDKQSSNKNENILDMIINVYDHMLSYSKDIYHFVNKMQTIRRKRKFTEYEIEKIIEHKASVNNDNLLLCAFHLLLDSFNEFKFTFSRLSEEDQSELKAFPIYNLAK